MRITCYYKSTTHVGANCSLEALLRRLPVNHVPDSLEVLGLAVLILEAVVSVSTSSSQRPNSQQRKQKDLLVRMLPRINPQNRPKLPDDRILIRIRPNLDTPCLCILHQPRPPTPLDAGQRSIELLLERIQAAIAIINRLGQGTSRGLASSLALWCEVLPEKGMVDVSAAVEVDEGLERDLRSDVGGSGRFGELFGEVVEGGYVSVVVVFVVQFHDFAGDGGLEGAVVVCGGLLGPGKMELGINLTIEETYMGGQAEWPFHG